MKQRKPVLIVFVLFTLLCLLSDCQASDLKDKSAVSPKITFKKLTHDFGEVGPRTTHFCAFEFTNTGNDLLEIKYIKPSCSSCTVAGLDKKQYQPGESGKIKIKFRESGSLPGPAGYSIFVATNDPETPEVKLLIKAQIVLKVEFQPQQLNLLLKSKNAACPDITLTSIDSKPFAIKKFESTADCITADYDISAEDTKFVLQPKVDMEKLQENLKGNIKIELTHPQLDEITIPYSTPPQFQAVPKTIALLKPEPLKPLTRDLLILNNYGEDFEIESISSQKGIIKFLSQEKTDHGYKLELQIIPPKISNKKRMFSDTLFVKIKDGEKLKVFCRGFYSRRVENK